MRPIYINEINQRAAAWLRWLILNEYLPHGEVDTRSIRDVQPGDLAGYRQHHFFAGIGGWPLAALLAGWPADRPLWTGSCPCQPFSAAGRRQGADDERHVWPDFFRLIDACRPATVVGEQVAGALGYDWFDGVAADLGAAHYESRAVDIPAAAVDSPQIRQRLYWLAAGGAGPVACAYQPLIRQEPPAGQLPVDERHGGHDGDVRRLAGRPGGGSWREEPQRGPQGRTAAPGDDAGEHPSGGVDQVDASRERRGEGRSEHEIHGWGNSAASPDVRLRPRRPGGDRGPVAADADGGYAGAALGRASGRGLEIGKLTGWGSGTPARWLDAAGADDRNGSWWSGADWIVCHDDKARRVADAGAPLLVTGFPGRVAAWSGVGNAICVPEAVEVLKAVMETT